MVVELFKHLTATSPYSKHCCHQAWISRWWCWSSLLLHPPHLPWKSSYRNCPKLPVSQASLVIVVVVVVIISSFLSFLPFLSFSPRHFPLPTSHKRKQKQKQKQKRARCSFTQQSDPPHISHLTAHLLLPPLIYKDCQLRHSFRFLLTNFNIKASSVHHHITTSPHRRLPPPKPSQDFI